MPDRESAGGTAAGRRPRITTRGRVVIGIALGVMLGGGAFVTTSGVAGASDSTPPVSQDLASSVPASEPASASGSASPSGSASAPPSGSASASASASAPAVSAAPVDAPPRTRTGQSVVLSAAQQPSQVGALFNGSIAAGHHCTASVVDSPAGDVIVTAAHCLSSGASSHVFVPAYRDGTAPYGVWKISQVLEDSAWTSSRDPDHDVAFAVVEPLKGRSLESVVGSYGLDTSGTADTTVQITGYPTATDKPISCTGRSERFTSTQLTVYCTAYADGTSGSGWVEDYNPTTGSGTLIGVIGGYQTGGDTEDVSYAAAFGANARALYDRAVAIG
jgi:V8-like Glu-specific endopeptidase